MRAEGFSTGGYVPTPHELVPSIAALCARGPGDHYSVVDPCAGDGAAVVEFAQAAMGTAWSHVHLYAVEMEAARWRKLSALSGGKAPVVDANRMHVLYGDAFAVEFKREGDYGGTPHAGASAILLNPPYNLGHLESRFLDRFTDALCQGGVLVLIVPYTALDKLAATLAQHYKVAAVFKFPEPLFSQERDRAYKQVVVYATRRTALLDPNPAALARLVAMSGDAELIHVLPTVGTCAPVVTIPGHPYHRSGFGTWRMRPVDTAAVVARFVPLHATDKRGALVPIPGMMPPPVADLLQRRYPVATPLRPAHIATAIAAGVFDGERITPDDAASGWPDLLVKGTFVREFVEVDEKTNKDGEKTASIKVQKPRLSVVVLDLRARKYHKLIDSEDESDATTVEQLTTADLLAVYGKSLLDVMLANCPVLHDPSRPEHEIHVADVARPLYRAQAHTVMATVKLLGGDKPVVVPRRARYKGRKSANPRALAMAVRRHYAGKTAIVLGEPGTGKSSIALAAMKTIAAPVIQSGGIWRTLVLCPPHLLKSWRDQVAFVVPEARVRVISSVSDVDDLAAERTPGMVVAILSREMAKLGHAWNGVTHTRVLLHSDERYGLDHSPARRVRKGEVQITLRVDRVGCDPDTQDDGELFVAIEESRDGVAWRMTAAFTEATRHGAERRTHRPDPSSRWLRVMWSSTGPAVFSVHEEAQEEAACPRCGTAMPRVVNKTGAEQEEELARKRLRCPRTHRVAHGALAHAARVIAETIYPAYPHAPEVRALMTGRIRERIVERAASLVPNMIDEVAGPMPPPEQMARFRTAWSRAQTSARLRYALDAAVASRCKPKTDDGIAAFNAAIEGLLWAIADDDLAVRVAVRIYESSAHDKASYGVGRGQRDLARAVLLMVSNAKVQEHGMQACMATGMHDISHVSYGGGQDPWPRWRNDRDAIRGGARATGYHDQIAADRGRVTWSDVPRGSGTAAVIACGKLAAVGAWRKSDECKEPLYEATADPDRGGRRYALSKYIARRHRKLFDMMVGDEIHEAANENSAQARAAWRLAGLGMPVIAMTGTAMGGYAKQLWAAQYALDPEFRDEFARDQRSLFVDRYGYVKVQERDVNRDTGTVVAYGSNSDRVQREVRILGDAPGVLPLFLLRYLLRVSPVLHKADLAIDLPPCREIHVQIEPGAVLAAKAGRLLAELQMQIKQDRFSRDLAGKLWGALAHLATEYPLLASEDTGNTKGGAYQIRYPDNRMLGVYAGKVVVSEDGLPRDEVLPMEQWAIDTCRAELAEGRRCMVMATSSLLLPRLRRILAKALQEPVVYLEAKKVDTGHREDWINENIVTPGVRVGVFNPEAIQTGLNPLVHFATQLWLQNPNCKAITARQAWARIDRIGQTASETRIYTATYALPAAQAAHSLWMHKISVSLATDGLDGGGALAAAGVGGSDGARLDGFAVGKLIFDLMSGERTFKSRRHDGAGGASLAEATATKVQRGGYSNPQRRAP